MTQTYRNLNNVDAIERLIWAIRLRANAELVWNGESYSVIIK